MLVTNIITTFLHINGARPTYAASYTWDGGGVTNNWSDCDNWSTNVCPVAVDSLTFNGTSTKDSVVDAGWTASSGQVTAITIAAGYTGTLSLSRSLTLSGTFSIADGTFNTNNYAFSTTSSFTISGGAFNGGSSTMNVDSTFTISGGTFTSTSGNFNVGEHWTHTAGGTFNHNNGTVIFDEGGSTLNVDTSETFYNVEVNKGLNESLGIATGDTLIVANNTTLTRGYVNSGGAGATFEVRGHLTAATTYQQGSITYSFSNSTVDQTFSGAGLAAWSHPITINKASGTVTQGANFTSDSPFTVSSGTYNVTTYTFSMSSGAFTISGGTFNAGSGTITYSDSVTVSGGTFNGQSATIDLNHDLAISGDTATFNSTSGSLNIIGHWTHTGAATFNHNSGTVVFDRGDTFKTTFNFNTSETFYNLTVNPAANGGFNIATGDSLITVGALNLTEGAVGTGTLRAEGAVTIASTYDGGTAPLHFRGGSDQTLTMSAAGVFDSDMVVNKTAGTVNLSGNLTMDAASQDLTLTAGAFDLNGYNVIVNGTSGTFPVSSGATLRLQGGETITANATYPSLASGSTVYYDGTSAYTLKDYTYHHLTIDGSGGVFTLAANESLAGNLTITAGTLSQGGFTLAVTGTFSNTGTLRRLQVETFTGTMDVDSGTVEYIGNGDGASDTVTITDFGGGGTDYYNLKINDTNVTKDVFALGATVTVGGTLQVTSGTLSPGANGVTAVTLTVDGGTFTGAATALDANGSVTISSGTLAAPDASGSFAVQGNITKSGGTFTHNSGTVVLDANANHTITGNVSWNSLTLQDTSDNATDVILTVAASSTQTINGTLTLDGLDASDRLNIVSSSPSTAATTTFEGTAGFSGDYLDITDNTLTDNSSNIATPLNPANSVNGGNTTNWFTPPGITVSAISGNTTESGGTATFTVVLDAMPSDSVSIGISSSDTTEGTVSADTLIFTTGNWSSAQTITVTGVNDILDDGDIVYNIVTAAATSNDAGYNGINGADVSVTNTDDDVTLTGTVYSDAGSTTMGNGPTVKILLDGSALGTDTLDSGNGTYSIAGALAGGTVLTAFLDGSSEDGVTVTLDNNAAISGLNVYQNTLIVRTETGTALTNANLDTAHDGDADITSIYANGGSTALDLAGNLVIPASHTYAPGGTINIAGNWTNSGTFTNGSSTVTFDGSSQTLTGATTFSTLVVASSGTVSLANDTVATTGTISSGTLSLNGSGLTVSGTFSNSGTLRLRGSETLSITQDIDSGTVTYVGDADSAADTFTLKDFGGTDYYNLTIATTDTADILQSGAAKSIAGTFGISSGTYDANGNTTLTSGTTTVSGGTYSASTNTQTFANLGISGGTFTGGSGSATLTDLNLSSGTLTAPSGTMTVNGNWNKTGGTFTHNNGTVVLATASATAVNGSNTFYNFSSTVGGKTLTFQASQTQTMASGGTFTLTGASGNLLTLVSSTTGTRWGLTVNGNQSVSYVNVKDSDASGGSAIIPGTGSISSGNNLNWSFNASPSAPTNLFSNTSTSTAQSGVTNPGNLTDTTPAFSAVYVDTDAGDSANKYCIQVNTASDWAGTDLWYSDGAACANGSTISNITAGLRSSDIEYAGSALSCGTNYYWRIKFWDDEPSVGSWSSTAASFQINCTATVSNASGSTTEDTTYAGDLSHTDGDNDSVTYSVVSTTTRGTTTLVDASAGTFTYVPTANYNGSDSFTYRVNDGTADSNTATFTITVTAVNDAPVANAGSDIAVNETDGGATLNASESFDIESSPLTYVWIETIDSGDGCNISSTTSATPIVTIVNRESSYSCVYQLTVNDGTVDSATDTVTISVTGVNDPPAIVVIDDKTIALDNRLTFTIGANDADTEYVALTASDDEGDFQAIGEDIATLFEDNGNNTGTFDWVPNQPGTYTTTFAADDQATNVTQVVNITVTGTVEDDISEPPTFSGALPNVSFIAGNTIPAFNLDEYFSDDVTTTLTYSVTGTKNIDARITNGQVTFSAPIDFSGSEELVFQAQDEDSQTASSNTIVVSVMETIAAEEISSVIGTNDGAGVITVYDNNGNIVATWQAFSGGGVIPRLATIRDQVYVFAVKRTSGTTMHVYTLNGKTVKKKRISPNLHWRKLASGKLDSDNDTEEIVIATTRGRTIYFKIFSFKPQRNKFHLIKRAHYRAKHGTTIKKIIRGNNYRVNITQKQIYLRSKNGRQFFRWQPFH